MSNETMKKSLKDRAKEFSVNLPFMEGREKADVKELIGTINTIDEYGFLSGDDGDYAVFTVKERAGKFYFAGMVLTDQLQQLEAEGYHEEINAEGLPVLLTEKKAKKGNRTYVNVEFYPE